MSERNLEIRTNDFYAEFIVDGEFVASTTDMEFVATVPKLAHRLGIGYSVVHGEWNTRQEFVPSRRD